MKLILKPQSNLRSLWSTKQNEKVDNQNIGYYSYDSDCIYWGGDIYYLEWVFDYGFHHYRHKKKGIYRRKT